MKTKIQLITDCFNELRMSGVTSNPSNEDVSLALSRLEDMMAEFLFELGFRFEDTPNPNTPSGLQNYANYPIAMALAVRMAPLYGKAPEMLIRQASAAMDKLSNRTAMPNRVAYPSRMPLGMGNRRFYRAGRGGAFFPESQQIPRTVDTEVFVEGSTKAFTLDFATVLKSGEIISSYMKVVSSGLTISAESFATTIISFTASAANDGYYTVTFTVTGSLGTIAPLTFSLNVIDQSIQRAN